MINELPPYHPQYLENVYMWQVARDTIAGESTVKARKTRYLPMPAAMTINPEQTPINLDDNDFGMYSYNHYSAISQLMMRQFNPNYHNNRAYQAYITRAQFPELPAFILRGLLGLTSNELPTVKLPSSMEYLKEEATVSGLSLNEYYMHLLSETLSVGRIASVLEINKEGNIVMAPYSSESIANWKTERSKNSAKKKPTMVVLSEFEDTKPNRITQNLTPVYKILILQESEVSDEDDVYYIKEVSESEIVKDTDIKDLEGSTIIPEYKGEYFNEIPIQIFGPVSNSFNVQNSPLAAVASTALQIYMKYADLSNSEFMSCSPTLVISGVSEEFAPKAVGSTIALILPDESAKAYYTSTDTSALTHVLRHITDLYEQAIYAGAQLLDSSKKAAESAETTRLKQAASGATLSSVVRNVTIGLQNQLKLIAKTLGEDPNDVVFSTVTDFSAPTLTAQEQNALVTSWLAGAFSHETLLENFRKAGMLHDGETIDDEIERIKRSAVKPNEFKKETKSKENEEKEVDSTKLNSIIKATKENDE